MKNGGVIELLEQFYPEELSADEREAWCRWWYNLTNDQRAEARKVFPADAMVADVATFDRGEAYRLTINANDQLLYYRKQCQRLREQVEGLKAVNRMLNSELDRRLRHED